MKNESIIERKGILALKEETIRKIEDAIKQREEAKKLNNKENKEALKEFYTSIENFYRFTLTQVEELLK